MTIIVSHHTKADGIGHSEWLMKATKRCVKTNCVWLLLTVHIILCNHKLFFLGRIYSKMLKAHHNKHL